MKIAYRELDKRIYAISQYIRVSDIVNSAVPSSLHYNLQFVTICNFSDREIELDLHVFMQIRVIMTEVKQLE